MAADTAPLRPHGIVHTVEVVHDHLARQAVDAAPIEDVTNVAEQHDGGIFIPMFCGKGDGPSPPQQPLQRLRCFGGKLVELLRFLLTAPF